MTTRTGSATLGRNAAIALTSLPELPDAICRALEHSDHIVMVLEIRNDELCIVAANSETQRVSGYATHQLAGQKFAFFAGPESDATEIVAVRAAVQTSQLHYAQVRCRTAAGDQFWLGLQIMPTCEPGAPNRSLVISRDITTERRLRDQDHAIHSLLAKAFVTIDVPLYVTDQKGFILMANPALERLLGCRPGALQGTPALDRYAARSKTGLVAAQTKQDADGLEFTLNAVLLGPDGQELTRRVTGAMVQRGDLPRFRIVVVRPDQPVAAPPRISATGRIQLVGLEEVRDALGPKWDSFQDRAIAMAEHVVKRHLGPADTFSRTDDQGFVICFAHATEQEASFRAASIAREVRRKLICEGETPEVAHVFSAATALPGDAGSLPEAELAFLVRDRIAERLHAMQNAARDRLRHALQEASYEMDVVRGRGRDEAVGVLCTCPNQRSVPLRRPSPYCRRQRLLISIPTRCCSPSRTKLPSPLPGVTFVS